MFDSFILKNPITCPRCKTGRYTEFQTKDLESLLHEYCEGEIAGVKETRECTEEEERERVKRNKEEFGLDDTWAYLLGCLAGIPTGNVIKILEDGKYPAYTYCNVCKEFFYINAIVENEIFTRAEIEEISVKRR
jgi:hypothetical protein